MVTATLLGVLTGALGNLSADTIKALLVKVLVDRPEVKEPIDLLETPMSLDKVNDLFSKMKGAIQASAATGKIELSHAYLNAISGIKLDHQKGQILVDGMEIEAPILVTGGSTGAIGSTFITGETTMTSQGTSVKVSGRAKITITGDAQIIQN